jgi:hypothetical protein
VFFWTMVATVISYVGCRLSVEVVQDLQPSVNGHLLRLLSLCGALGCYGVTVEVT